jgi:hypothetical protein
MRRELEHTYDQELRTRRMESYMSLYKQTDTLPRHLQPKQPSAGRYKNGPAHSMTGTSARPAECSCPIKHVRPTMMRSK